LPQGNLLIDTPTELREQLLRERIGLVHAVAFTHEHADHLHGLDDLRLFPYYLGHPVPVFCESKVEQRIRKCFDYIFDPQIAHYPAGAIPQLTFERIGLEPFWALGQRVIPLRLRHGSCDVLGFRFGNVAYCTDTNEIPDESYPLLAGLDVLILDCLRPTPHPTHLHLEAAVQAAQRIGARRTFFTHLSCRLEHEATNAALPLGIECAYDGLRLPLT